MAAGWFKYNEVNIFSKIFVWVAIKYKYIYISIKHVKCYNLLIIPNLPKKMVQNSKNLKLSKYLYTYDLRTKLTWSNAFIKNLLILFARLLVGLPRWRLTAL